MLINHEISSPDSTDPVVEERVKRLQEDAVRVHREIGHLLKPVWMITICYPTGIRISDLTKSASELNPADHSAEQVTSEALDD